MKRVYHTEYNSEDIRKFRTQRMESTALKNRADREKNPTKYHLKELAVFAACLVPPVGIPLAAAYFIGKKLTK